MKPSLRVLIVGIVFELLLFGLGAFLLFGLASGSMRPSTSVADATSTITSVLGGVMGALGGLVLVIYIVLKRRGS